MTIAAEELNAVRCVATVAPLRNGGGAVGGVVPVANLPISPPEEDSSGEFRRHKVRAQQVGIEHNEFLVAAKPVGIAKAKFLRSPKLLKQTW